jgi:2-keto-4-pentenoate hydratase/2-oxohepta-3-ene-1,7-dioic acid hydratase in catechol pathway
MHYQHAPLRILAAALEDPYLNIQELLPGDVILMGTPAGTILKASDLQKLLPRDLLYPLYHAQSHLLGYLQSGDELWAESDILGFHHNVVQGI